MGVTIISNGGPVTMSSRVWSWNSSAQVIGAAAAVSDLGATDLQMPDYVWRTQRSVRTVVGFIANNIAQVPLHAFERVDDRDRVRLRGTDSLLAALVESPYPARAITPFEFMNELVIDRCMWNRHASLKLTDGVRPSLLRLHPRRWKFRRDAAGLPEAVCWTRADGNVVEYPIEQTLWFDGYRIGEEYTPMDALFDLLTEQTESGRYRTTLWQNGGRFPGWIERPLEAPEWSTTGRDRFRTGWQKFATGGEREGMTPLLEDGMTYKEATQGVVPKDAQQIETRKLSLAEVAAAFYLPPVFAGLLDSTSHSNVTAYREQLYSDVLGPDFQAIGQAWNLRVVPDVDPAGRQYVEFNVAEKLRMSFDEQVKIFQTAVGGPFMLRSEARSRTNLPYIEGTDELIVPLNVIEGGQASPTDSTPPGR